MKIIRSIVAMQAEARGIRQAGRRIGFVPTMGCLHEGHLALIRKARELADCVVVSIFVNPTQFGPQEDYTAYPRDLERDACLCSREGVEIVFHPDVAEMYPAGHGSVFVDEKELSAGLCGPFRPGHFRGVLTVVANPNSTVGGPKTSNS